MVGYKYPHPMPFPAPSPAIIASSAAKGVSVRVHSLFSVAANMIILEEDEYFTSISGYFHALSNYQGHAIVMKGSMILGFLGRAGTAIDAIGIHCSLPN
ncbi:hypothetical protein OPV22_022191 [Ensete ventricosum]|uniref:Dirigent protein n=1 Tax=Ensete ventricosum TaxID=4639 RepID=A0AAV8QTQ7_ENSVE|nr:hypothetical protein OPV22_022191 [Ensete ventricosum]